jgi:outer membrane lipoprotein-sorting protein
MEESSEPIASDSSSPEVGDALEQVFDEIEGKIEALSSYRATFEMIFSEEETVTGEIAFLRPDKMRMKIILGEDEQTRQELYSDGVTLWQYLPYYKMASKVDLEALKEEFPEEAAALVEGQSDIQGALAEIDKGRIVYHGFEDLDGQSMYVFEGQADASCEAELEVVRIKVWISKADGLQRRVEYYSNEDELIYQHRLEKVDVNIEIPDETFHFEPPQDVTVLDTTEQSMQLFREMEAEEKE